MTEKKDNFVEAVTKLIKLTQEGKIKWRSVNFVRHDIKVENAFITKYKDRSMRLYKYEYEVQEPIPSIAVSIFPYKRKYPYWETSITLEFIDSTELGLWKFPYTSALIDLLQAVQYQVAEVDEFLDDIMAEE